MREFRFKAWDQYHTEMINWEQYQHEMVSDDFLEYNKGPLKIMQWTGLTDKNGVDIYEGDIIKTEEGLIVKVVWDKVKFKCLGSVEKTYQGEKYIDRIEFELRLDSSDKRFGVEVLGNIFENPEILKGEL